MPENTSRIIVKNLPKYLTCERFKDHFGVNADVTDAKIMMTSSGKSRQFGFLGFKTEQEAYDSVEYFDNTFIDTTKIRVELAKSYGNPELPSPRSRHSRRDIMKSAESVKENDQNPANEGNIERLIDEKMANDPKLREFLHVMRPKSHKKIWENDDNVAEMSQDTDYMPKSSLKEADDEEYQDLPTPDHPSQHDNDPDSSKDKLEINESESQAEKEREKIRNEVEKISDLGRLFVRNLSYSCTENDLKALFEQYGPVSEVHLPINSDSKQPKGFAYVLFMIPENAVAAYVDLDGKIFQGRLLHIIPADDKPGSQFKNGEQNSFKQKRAEQLKQDSMKEETWNSLFMSSDAVAEAMASELDTTKGDILDAESDNAAVKLALAETHIIQETIKYLQEEGVCIDVFKPNAKKERSDTVIMVKNIPFRTSESQIREIFGRYGDLMRVVLPPSRTMALVEYSTSTEAKVGFKSLAYKNFQGRPLMLEKAPIGVFLKSLPSKTNKDELENDADSFENIETQTSSVTLFVKNLNFKTTNESLASVFRPIEGFRSAKISTKKDVKTGKLLSMGFGFVEFADKESAKKALSTLQRTILDSHSLQLKISEKSLLPSGSSTQRRVGEVRPDGTKLIVRNVPFEATRKDIVELFGTFGQLKRVRLPKKFDGSTHRGFAFVDFLTKKEAKNAFESLHSTHLYGRHLVLEWAKDDESIDTLREKTKRIYETANNTIMNKKRHFSLEDDGSEQNDDGEI